MGLFYCSLTTVSEMFIFISKLYSLFMQYCMGIDKKRVLQQECRTRIHPYNHFWWVDPAEGVTIGSASPHFTGRPKLAKGLGYMGYMGIWVYSISKLVL